VGKLDCIQGELIATGNLSKPFDVNKMVDVSVREKAIKLLEH
jgi:hypothetical protein